MSSQEQVYIDYLNYDWELFSEFQQGLEQILENYLDNLKEQDPSVTTIPALDRQVLVDQAKSFFYCSHTGNILNLDDFQQWKIANGDKYIKNQKVEEIVEQEVEKSVAEDTNEPPYSSNYQNVVELIMSGKPVPGIKTIPDTVLPEQSSVASAKQRVKPWEKTNE